MSLIHVSEEDMDVVHVSKVNRLRYSSTSKGNQLKWVKDNKYIKLNTFGWYEDISEVLVSYLLSFTSIDYFVKYRSCKIVEDGNIVGIGCYSENYLSEGEQDISFYRILKNNGVLLEDADFNTVRDTVFDTVGFDIKEYISNCLCLDAITYNEDRHFNNFSVIKGVTGYRVAPLYDNGLSCLADTYTYSMKNKLKDNLRLVCAKPFNSDFKYQITSNLISPINIDVEGFLSSVYPETKQEVRAFNVIKAGLKETEGVAWERY